MVAEFRSRGNQPERQCPLVCCHKCQRGSSRACKSRVAQAVPLDRSHRKTMATLALSERVRPLVRLLTGFALLVIISAPRLEAEPHRARLAGDLAQRIAQRIESATDIIVAARQDRIDALAARYGATVKKRITGGAVLRATGGQIDALSQDSEV